MSKRNICLLCYSIFTIILNVSIIFFRDQFVCDPYEIGFFIVLCLQIIEIGVLRIFIKKKKNFPIIIFLIINILIALIPVRVFYGCPKTDYYNIYNFDIKSEGSCIDERALERENLEKKEEDK